MRFRMKIITKKGAIRLACLFALILVLCLGCWSCMISMPGTPWSGELPPLTEKETAISASLRRDVEMLAGEIGVRNHQSYANLLKAADAIEERFEKAGLVVARQTFETRGKSFHNIEVELAGSGGIVVVGAHYDTAFFCPGANDNGTGVAALLALAEAFAKDPPSRTIRFVAFCNEEPPFFRTEFMGSRVYAKRCKEREEDIVAMLSLETMGFYSDEEGSQEYPFPLSLCYPSKGDFIAFVGNVASRGLVRDLVRSFREKGRFPSQGGALPGWLPGVGWSDHEQFWEIGVPAVMVTDTAVFRYPYYHFPQDTPAKVDFDRCARVVAILEEVIRDLAEARE